MCGDSVYGHPNAPLGTGSVNHGASSLSSTIKSKLTHYRHVLHWLTRLCGRCESCRGMEWELDRELYALPGFRCDQVLPMVLVVWQDLPEQPPLSRPGGRAGVAGRRRRKRDRSSGAATAARRAAAAHRHLEADRRVPALELTADGRPKTSYWTLPALLSRHPAGSGIRGEDSADTSCVGVR